MKPAYKFGLLGGSLLSILLITGYSLEWHKTSLDQIWPYLNLVIIILTIYFGVKASKKLKPENEISYRDATFEGLKILLISALMHSATMYFYFASNENRFLEYKAYVLKFTLSMMQKGGTKQADINKYVELVKAQFTPFNLAKDNLIYDSLLGLIFVLIVASILRKKHDAIPQIKQ